MFHYREFTQELELIQNGQFRQSEIFNVDLSNVLTDKEITLRGNCLILLPRLYLNNQVLLTDAGANSRAFIRFNNPDAPAMPFSLIANSQDVSGFTGTYYRLFITVPTAVAGKVLYFVSLLGAGLASATGGTGASGSVQQFHSGGGK